MSPTARIVGTKWRFFDERQEIAMFRVSTTVLHSFFCVALVSGYTGKMKAFVHGMAALSGVRDRDALNAAFVRLVMQTVDGSVCQVALVRVVGDGEDRRCLVCARLDAGSEAIVADPVWQDWSELPLLTDKPGYARVVADGVSQVTQNGALHSSLHAVVGEQGTWGLLEIVSVSPLDEVAHIRLAALLQTYQNVLGLLDYGEKDALTELLNRKTFDGAFFKATASTPPSEIGQGDRREPQEGGQYWLAVLDIDHFKRVNDTYGHLIGDEVLLLVARIMRNSFRFNDQLYRFGGEEFVILMYCRDVQGAAQALERLRLNVENYAFPQVGVITVSLGFSGLLSHDTPSAAFGRADKAVYHAKSNGRNQVVSYQDLVNSGVVKEQTEDMDIDWF